MLKGSDGKSVVVVENSHLALKDTSMGGEWDSSMGGEWESSVGAGGSQAMRGGSDAGREEGSNLQVVEVDGGVDC